LETSIPAVAVVVSGIFVDPALSERTWSSGNHSGPVKTAGAIRLPEEPREARVGFDPTPATPAGAAAQDGVPVAGRGQA
jgi:hypothetical protein